MQLAATSSQVQVPAPPSPPNDFERLKAALAALPRSNLPTSANQDEDIQKIDFKSNPLQFSDANNTYQISKVLVSKSEQPYAIYCIGRLLGKSRANVRACSVNGTFDPTTQQLTLQALDYAVKSIQEPGKYGRNPVSKAEIDRECQMSTQVYNTTVKATGTTKIGSRRSTAKGRVVTRHYFFYPRVQGVSLLHLINTHAIANWELDRCLTVAINLLNAVLYYQRLGVIVQDAKFEDTFVDGIKVALVDWGNAIGSEELCAQANSRGYCGPEASKEPLSTLVHIVGILLRGILAATRPFRYYTMDGKTMVDDTNLFNIRNLRGYDTDSLNDFLNKVHHPEPKQRPSLQEVKQSLEFAKAAYEAHKAHLHQEEISQQQSSSWSCTIS